MPLDIAKTLMTTREVLFTRYAIKCVHSRSIEKPEILSTIPLKLALFNVGILFAFSAVDTTQFLPLSDASVSSRSLKDT